MYIKGLIRRTCGPESAKFDSLDLWLLAGEYNQTSPAGLASGMGCS